MEENKYTYRNIARVVLEASTPLAVGSGEKDIITDALVATDINGLPYIPGTAIAGVLRHAMGYKDQDKKDFFGYQFGKENHGSEIIFSEARLVDENGTAVDGLRDISGDFLSHFGELPIRQHVRISHKGVAEDAGKFDEQVVFKGSRFCFDIEHVDASGESTEFDKLLEVICAPNFRLGGGVHKGFGLLKVVSCQFKNLDLSKSEDLIFYLDYSSSLAVPFVGTPFKNIGHEDVSDTITFELRLDAEDFFMMGSGFGDDDADMNAVKEAYIGWEDNVGKFHENGVLIPASSIKGAIAHRTAYYYNLEKGNFADKIENLKEFEEKDNPAVTELFGCSGNGKSDAEIQPGKVFFSDIIEEELPRDNDKIMNHIRIDRFTGGTIDSALFADRPTYGHGQKYTTTVVVAEKVSDESTSSLRMALIDLCSGMLSLGGGTSRGNGCFSGELFENGIKIYPKEL